MISHVMLLLDHYASLAQEVMLVNFFLRLFFIAIVTGLRAGYMGNFISSSREGTFQQLLLSFL